HELRLENVGFRYPGMTYDVLHDINLTIKSGESIVLVGLNGAGKTTLIKLLTRLYDPTEGTIYLDGRDIREYDTDELYSLFGIIFQDFGRYAVSVKENIAFGDVRTPIDENRLKKAAKESNANSFIDNFDEGYDTQLMRYFEVTGKELSGGQWQKLAVARAFYGDSDILILDEPTASLDAIAEQEIFNQFEELRQGKLTVFVSHRLSSAVRASQIVVLSEGTILERGTHAELMKKGGVYHDLFLTQAERYIASVDGEENQEDMDGDGPFPPKGGRPPMDRDGRPMPPPDGKRPPRG
ncbi:MAG: ABC transporter ATP-binding protein, partial [Clostridia bacterium]|nr:ABC transporter ATP-binding protein [Clostridia bacterium]